MANALVSIADTYGRGKQDRQSETMNALRIDAARQGINQAQKQYSDQERMANTEWLANSTRYAMENPQSLPGLVEEGKRRGVLDPNFDPSAITPEALQEIHQNAMAALGAPQEREAFGAPVAGLDESGNPAYMRFSPTGGSQQVEGFSPNPRASGSSGLDEFNALSDNLSPEEKDRARRIKLGLDPRAVGSANITMAGDDDLTSDVADSQATIAQRKKFGEMTGSSRAKKIDDSFESIQLVDTNIRNIDRAIEAIDQGASTGAIESKYFPSFRESTVKLEQVQKELGLDVVGSVTFGALSKGELDLALAAALPTNLQPAQLREFLVTKKAAQEKLRQYYEEQIDFLDQGGTVAGFLRSKDRQTNSVDPVLQQAQEAIAAGADPAAVRQRLIDLGVDVSNL